MTAGNRGAAPSTPAKCARWAAAEVPRERTRGMTISPRAPTRWACAAWAAACAGFCAPVPTITGTLASAILTGASWADVDTGAISGLAITATTGNGTWQYSTDGTTWNSFGAVSSTNALLITSSTQVRYIPDSSNGETATFSYKAWDQTSGTASTNSTANYATTASSGGTTAFSSNSASAQIVVSSVNDAPTITNSYTHTLTTTNEDTTSSGTLASAILTGASWADIDASPVSGLAITAKTGNGTWQ